MKRLALVFIGFTCLLNAGLAAVPPVQKNALESLYNSTNGTGRPTSGDKPA